MTTATTNTIKTWKKEWKEFHNEALDKTWSNKELSPEKIKSRLKMFNHANENIDKIFTKLNEMETVFDKLAESVNVLHKLLHGENYEFQSLDFQITIDEHIQISFKPLDDTSDTMVVECKVDFENDCLLFSIDEHDPQMLEISLKS
ncbi:hypothetical protein ABEY80_11805 [Priestia megaterium]